MVIHHSLNNNLWDRKRTLLKISNQVAAREFANILMHGIARGKGRRAPVSRATLKPTSQTGTVGKSVNGRRNGLTGNAVVKKPAKVNSKKKRLAK
jgi:hypothetical protein